MRSLEEYLSSYYKTSLSQTHSFYQFEIKDVDDNKDEIRFFMDRSVYDFEYRADNEINRLFGPILLNELLDIICKLSP